MSPLSCPHVCLSLYYNCCCPYCCCCCGCPCCRYVTILITHSLMFVDGHWFHQLQKAFCQFDFLNEINLQPNPLQQTDLDRQQLSSMKSTPKASLRSEPTKPQQHYVAALTQQVQQYQTALPMQSQAPVHTYHFGPQTPDPANALTSVPTYSHAACQSSMTMTISTSLSTSISGSIGGCSGGVSNIYHRPVLSMPPVLLMGAQSSVNHNANSSPIIEMPPSPAPIIEYPDDDDEDEDGDDDDGDDDDDDSHFHKISTNNSERVPMDENDYIHCRNLNRSNVPYLQAGGFSGTGFNFEV